MFKDVKVQLNLCIPIRYRDLLRRMAAEKVLENPRKVITAASLASEFICSYLENIRKHHELKGRKAHDEHTDNP